MRNDRGCRNALYFDSKRRYGAPKIRQILLTQDYAVSLKRVQRLMKTIGLRSIVIKKYHHYSGYGKVVEKENILNREFEATQINQKWCTDITYIHVLKEGGTYLVSVMDFYSKKIIGYAYGKHMTAELALEAVKNACLNVKEAEGIILHSDLGSQYTSQLFEDYITKKKIKYSFSHKGCPYDNACRESFHSILKKEEIHVVHYKDFEESRCSLFEYIESWYNRKRIQGSLNYKTPQAVYESTHPAV